jgi:chorismate dehydratase
MRSLRISAISYLNTAPLMWDFEHGQAGADFEISYTVPSQCAAELAAGSADIGLIPAAAYATTPGLAILPGVAIASVGKVRSILLVSKVPVEEVRTVALDTCSLTSVALTKLLFAKWWGGARQFTAMAPDVEMMLQKCDAALIIGDPALKIDRAAYRTYDLAEEWSRLTGNPFVFAFWAVREDALKEVSALGLAERFQQSRDHGLKPNHLHQIAREWAPRTGLSPSAIMEYLTQNIHYYLDAPSLKGLKQFYEYAREYGALPSAPELEFLGETQLPVR